VSSRVRGEVAEKGKSGETKKRSVTKRRWLRASREAGHPS
jgi:hypothetical protein